GRVVAGTDAGNGLEAARRRHFDDGLRCALDWYHAAQHLHAYAEAAWPRDPPAGRAWAERARGVLYERGGPGLLEWLGGSPFTVSRFDHKILARNDLSTARRRGGHDPGSRVRAVCQREPHQCDVPCDH